ncbi:uncharacterized protein LOC133181774 [Saccostrea echinata]|uniref:uncharacterized protein LOC133181774 n=1 Tax=Saccostrea echinata TaxID=191078 RepID=UPI002A83BAD2|nr:uncharacterized protein LOC133181774 [Saccostrea echinata]
MAAMWSRKLSRLQKAQTCFRRIALRGVSIASLDEYNTEDEKATYPLIKPRFPPGKWGDMEPRVAWEWYDSRQEFMMLPTAEERIQLMDTKYCKDKYCHKYWNYSLLNRTPGNLKYQQIMTKTVLEEVPNLKDRIHSLDKINVEELTKVKHILCPIVMDILTEEHTQLDRRHAKPVLGYNNERVTEDKHPDIIIKRLLYVISTVLGNQYPQLSDMQITENVELAAHWEKYGIKRINPPNIIRKRHHIHNQFEMKTLHRKRTPFELQLNSRVYANGKVSFTVRSENPLPEFADVQECEFDNDKLKEDRLIYYENKKMEEEKKAQTSGTDIKGGNSAPPSRHLYPKSYGACFGDDLITVNPGFNLGDPAQFGYMFIQNTNKRKLHKMEQDYGERYAAEARIGWGMSTGFVWNVAQAHYQGFNSFIDITYPFTNFGILTDGRKFQFFANQLNTLQLWKNTEANPIHNMCWYTPEMALYETFEDNKIMGFDQTVLEHLINFLLCQPQEREYDIKPTLPADSPDKVKVEQWINLKIKTKKEEEEVVYDESQLLIH